MAKESNQPGVQQTEGQPKNPKTGKVVLIIVMALLLAILPAYGVWYWQQNEAKEQVQNLQERLDVLKKQKDDLQKQLNQAKEDQASVCPSSLTAAQTQNVQAAIESMDTAALEQLLADTIEVTFAASEKGGNVTKTQAIADLEYLDGATMPWNWNVDAATLNTYKNGDYKIYLQDDDIFGVAANKYFVSFRVDCGKIDQVFVAASTDNL